MKKFLKVLGNILWLLLTGLEAAIAWFILGAFWCVSIIGIPFGLQCFKFGKLSIWPMGRGAKTNFSKHPVANIIWLIFGGIFVTGFFFVVGAFWCVTIIGIPFGLQCFKLGRLAFSPFGAEIKSTNK